MHLGHLRTHLCAYLRARSSGGKIVMRIEDIDPPRVVPGSADAFLRDHEWLGLDWDEGPFYQSERRSLYADAVDRLLREGLAYPCTCSRKEIEALCAEPHGEDGPRYAGTCRSGPRHPERTPAIRFRMETAPRVPDVLHDYDAVASPGDFVVRRADGIFAYQLAVVVDDAAMGITEVVRGMDILTSTPRQIALQQALGLPRPDYLHVPLVLGTDGMRLAKSNGARGIASYREAGVEKERLLGIVGASLGLVPEGARATLDELRHAFSLDVLRAHAHEAKLVVPFVG